MSTTIEAIPFNINNRVRVRITEFGRKAWAEHWKPVTDIGRPLPEIKVDDEGYTEMQLWTAMEMFGPYMHMGFENVIDTDIQLCFHRPG